MSRPEGSKNKQAIAPPDTVNFTTEERIQFLAQLIAERIAEDKANGYPLLKRIEAQHGTGTQS